MNSFQKNSFSREAISQILDNDDIRAGDILSPKTAHPLQSCPINLGREIIDPIATFEELITNQDRTTTKIPIFNSRAAYFFNTKMAIDGLINGKEGNYSICKEGNSCYSTLNEHFFVMPQFTNWVKVGDLAVVINLKNQEQQAAYAICADLGPDETIVSNNNTLFKGKLGEGSIALGQHLKIDDWHLGNATVGPGGLGFQRDNIVYIVFPGSGLDLVINKNFSLKEVNRRAHAYFQCWGGWGYAQEIVKKIYKKTLKP